MALLKPLLILSISVTAASSSTIDGTRRRGLAEQLAEECVAGTAGLIVSLVPLPCHCTAENADGSDAVLCPMCVSTP